MNYELENTEFNPIVWTREEYEHALKEEKKLLEKTFRTARNAKFIIRCSAWFCLIMSIISTVILNNTFIAFINWAMAIMLIMSLKLGKYF